ncbi:MAG: hypothetical protein B6D63_00385 [Candidatus Latescibacteria bacterium 4484_7]|nr:MAG: hypothetical protein B6D63_00385 [Candidatus Latescibacteria bacterium 4484_7]
MGKVRIGVALSGGTARSMAHIGILKAFEEHGIEIDYLSGTSGGSLVAAFYASGKSIEEMENLAESLSWRKLAGLTLPKLGLLSSNKIREFVIDQIGEICFRDLKIPTVVVAADLTTGEKKIFKEGEVAIACQASSSIPEVYTPVEIEGHSFVDGGIVEYMPVKALSEFGEMFRIGVNLGYESGKRKRPRHLVEVIMEVTGFIANLNALESEKVADFVIRPDVERFSPFALNKAADLIEVGYVTAVAEMAALKEAIGRYASFTGKLRRFLTGVPGRSAG